MSTTAEGRYAAPASHRRVRTQSAGCYSARALLGERDGVHAHVLDRAVAGVGLDRLDLVNDVHAGGDAPEGGVLAVQPRGRLGGDDEELAAVGVRAGVCHGERAADDAMVVDLVGERVAGPARPRALRAS